MATSVKMDEDTKARLERLQAEIRLQTGTRVTQQELLARLVAEATESKADLVDSCREERVPLADAEREAFHEGMVSSGGATIVAQCESRGIDAVLSFDGLVDRVEPGR